MADTLLVFQAPVAASDGTLYEARACGSDMPGGTWQGWLEFVPLAGGPPLRSPRETTQPNRADTEYWATGLTLVYLEGALKRAQDQPLLVPVASPQPSVFAEPAPSIVKRAAEVSPSSVMNPFSVYEKGEPLLRRQLGALSAWHLVNIIVDYGLSDQPVERLNQLPAADLIELIVAGTKRELALHRSA